MGPIMQGRRHPALWLVLTGVFAAMTCVATLVLTVPSPTGGYMNLGDTVVLLGAYLLGPVGGAVAGGVGAALADLLAGYTVYAPATLVIKGLMALAAGTLYRQMHGKRALTALCGAVGEVPMVVGYWLYDALLLGSLTGALAGVPSNLIQAAFGAAASTLLLTALERSGGLRRMFAQ